jgi:cyclopropane fatty-acyl-phospholipid synthase-like methyltransferase
MAATVIHRLTLDPMRKYSNAFFSETTNMIKAKLLVVSEKKRFETFSP